MPMVKPIMAQVTLLLWLLQALFAHAYTSTQPLDQRQASVPAACNWVSETIGHCVTASKGSGHIPPANQAACLCYSSQGSRTSWVPNLFDRNVLSCANYWKTAAPVFYSGFRSLEGFCTSIGNVLQTSTSATTVYTVQSLTTPPPITAATTTISSYHTPAYYPPCMTVADIITSCIQSAPTPTYGYDAVLASCACYSSKTWAPNRFDDPLLSCVSYLKTADLSDHLDTSHLVGFCTNYGGGSISHMSITSATPTPPITSISQTTIILYTPETSALSVTTVSVKGGASSSFLRSAFGKLLWILAALVVDMVILR
ncbi:hypothetical protein NA56DRAFT_741595 [Hyaloscypha hepaticicola]|uniref:Extracellular membrane protein CFEM domain-containing protein n=1 Tax=Hyaloscypha hepaticicola TaxID=2082293 RepID=A0A2J6PE29_9HELO|nr:hypothetical protein NA56DRAFT_741595 [Hyaloscypha hepaticicola]